jgi:hypothetical protein
LSPGVQKYPVHPMRPYSDTWHELSWRLLKYAPNAAQQEITDWWFGGDGRFCLICGGERAGKSLTSVALLLPLLMVKGGNFWIVGPDYNQARVEFLYLYNALHGSGGEDSLIEGEPSMPQSGSQPWSMKFKWNATIRTRTSSEIQKLASEKIDGFLMVEAAQHLYEVWLKLSGRVAETRGFGILSGTLEKGLPWYADMLRRWKGDNEEGGRSFSLPTWSNTDIFPGGREDAEIRRLEATYPTELFLERFGAEPHGYHGSVLPVFAFERHVRRLEPVEGVPLELWCDPGTNCYCVLFVQYVQPFAYVLERIYDRGAIDHDVIEKVKAHPYYALVPKATSGQTGGVIDIAAKQRSQGGRSQVQLWHELANISLASQYVFENDTIEVLRMHLKGDDKGPWLLFNSNMANTRAPDGTALDVLAEPELWRWPERTFKQNEARRPIDKNNHAMKAIAYGLNWHTGFSLKKQAAVAHKRTIAKYF